MLNNLKIKDNNKLRISAKQDYYIFDFKYLTKNKKYNFKSIFFTIKVKVKFSQR